MAQRRLLHADAARLSAYLWARGSLKEEARFTANEAGVAAFAAYLRQHHGSLYYMLADVAEEGFQFELIPHVRGADRSAVIKRKLNQFFYGSPLTVALSLGRDKAGRRDERMLFAALTRPQAFDPWLGALRAAQCQLAGIYSIPLLAPTLARRLKLKVDQCLLVSVGRSGIRQTFLDNGRLRFSRLSSLAAASAAETARACAAESARIYQYLAGQRVVTRSTPLPVLILADPAHRTAFAAACGNSEELQFELLDFPAAARACGSKQAPQDLSSDALFLHLLAREPPSKQFAAAPERHFYRLWQARFALKSAGALALLGCLLFAAHELYEARTMDRQTQQILAQARDDVQRHADILKGLPPMPTSLDNLRAVVDRFDAVERRSAEPGTMYARISRALEESPEVEVERIDWQLSTNPDESVPLQDQRRTAANEPGAGMYAVALISGTLPLAQAGDQRGLLDRVNAFVDALRRDPGLRVTVLRMPFEVESAKTLRSGGEAAAAADTPRFSVRISYKLSAAAK